MKPSIRLALVGIVWLVGASTGTSAPLPKVGAGTNVYHDGFDGKLVLDWKVIRADETHVSLKKVPSALVITTQRGTIHGKERKDEFSEGTLAKNLHVIDNPFGKDDWVATTCVSGFTPDTIYQQAGLLVYDGDDDYLKWGYETDGRTPAGQQFVMVAESGGVPVHVRTEGSESGLKKYWLRLTKRGETYEFAWSADGKKWNVSGERAWGDGKPKQVGLIAKNGGNKDAPERDAAFEFFELRGLEKPAK